MKSTEEEQLDRWHDENEFDRIIRYVDLLKDPTVELLSRKAVALNNSRRYREAIEVLETIREDSISDALWYYRYGYALLAIGKYEEAEKYLLKSVSLDAGNDFVWQVLRMYYQVEQPDAEKYKWVIDHLNPDAKELGRLPYGEFITGQTWNKEHILFKTCDFKTPKHKKIVLSSYERFVYALESVVTKNEELPKLALVLIESIAPVFQVEYTKAEKDSLMTWLINEFVYALVWFNVDPSLFEELTYMYTSAIVLLLADENRMDPNDMSQLSELMDAKDYQGVIDFYENLPESKQTYQYAQWAIQCYINLENYEDALICLMDFKNEGLETFLWKLWLGTCLAGLGHYPQAKDQLLITVDMNPYSYEAWTQLEDVYRYGLHDTPSAEWAREQREQFCKE